jgi:nucleoside-diphosphate-sugar epimerase
VVTGFAGLIASHPTGRLLANWHPVVGIDSFTEVRGLRLSVAGDGVSAPRKRR